MTYVAITYPSDTHARLVVAAARNAYGKNVFRWFGQNFPTDSHIKFRVGPGRYGELSIEQNQEIWLGSEVKSVWFRRPKLPTFTCEGVGDAQIIEREARAVFTSIFPWLGRYGLWINSCTSKLAAESKMFQLEQACRIGFQIPETIVTNVGSEVRKFAKEIGLEKLLVKTFTPARWTNAKGEMALYATLISPNEADESLTNSALIWQAPVKKAYEVRATVFGRTCIAVKVDSQSIPEGSVDWRAGRDRVPISPYLLPKEVQELCFSLMKILGIVFAAFDLVVTPSGEYIFLEVNEAGQFLWIEKRCPDVPMLDAFTQFFLSGDEGFEYKAGPKYGLHEIVASDYYVGLCETDNCLAKGGKGLAVIDLHQG